MGRNMSINVETPSGIQLKLTILERLAGVDLHIGPFIELESKVLDAAIKAFFDCILEELKDDTMYKIEKDGDDIIHVDMIMDDANVVPLEITKVMDGIHFRIPHDQWLSIEAYNRNSAISMIYDKLEYEFNEAV